MHDFCRKGKIHSFWPDMSPPPIKNCTEPTVFYSLFRPNYPIILPSKTTENRFPPFLPPSFPFLIFFPAHTHTHTHTHTHEEKWLYRAALVMRQHFVGLRARGALCRAKFAMEQRSLFLTQRGQRNDFQRTSIENR